jgi:uncharacterized protein (DUF433 family)
MEELLKRITFDQSVLAGKPIIRGLRISVEMILELLAKGASEEEILADYPELEPEDIRASLWYALNMVSHETVIAGGCALRAYPRLISLHRSAVPTAENLAAKKVRIRQPFPTDPS